MMNNLSRLIEDAVIFHDGKWPNESYDSIRFGGDAATIFKHEFNEAADSLRGKPDWSEVLEKHPQAQYLAQWPGINGRDLGLWISYETRPDCENANGYVVDSEEDVFHHSSGSILGDWRNTLEKRPEQKVESNESAGNWFERGEMPPVGATVEIAESTEFIKISHPAGTKVKIYAHFTDDRGVNLAAFVDQLGTVGGVAVAEAFKPIRTEREKFIDAAMAVGGLRGRDGAKEVYGALFEAGFKAPDNKKPD